MYKRSPTVTVGKGSNCWSDASDRDLISALMCQKKPLKGLWQCFLGYDSSLCLITFKVLLFVIWMCVFQIWGQHPNLPLRWTLKGAFQRFEVELHFPELDGPTLASKDEAMSLLMLSRCEKKFCSLKLTYQHWALSTAASDDLFMINYRTERCCYSSSSGEHECLYKISW